MRKFLKRTLFCSVFVLSLLSGCSKKERISFPDYTPFDPSAYRALEEDGYKLIDFYTLNDFHGAVEFTPDENKPGISRMAQYLIDRRSENPGGTIFLAAGDMWQGSADSNLTKGELMVDELNYIGFSAFTVGNHEFDWTIDQIKININKSTHPFLGANIVNKGTTKRVDWLDASTLIERDGVKIGIIGTIGSSLESTVQASLIADIDFDVITDYVVTEASQLRENGAEIVVLNTHDSLLNGNYEYDEIINNKIVDAIFCGHQHVHDRQIQNGIPILQTTGLGRGIQYVRFAYKENELVLKDYRVDSVLSINPTIKPEPIAEQIYKYHLQDVEEIKNEVVGRIKNGPMKIEAIGNLTVRAMVEAVPGAVGAMHNVRGGIRAELPNGKVTYGDIYKSLPFDNEIIIMELTGSQLKGLIGSPNSNNANYFTININDIDNTGRYKVLTISYLYERDYQDTYNGEVTATYARDAVSNYFKKYNTIDVKEYL